jgi:hypothetical protein
VKNGGEVWVWWRASVISALGKLRQEDGEFDASLIYIMREREKKREIQAPLKKKNSLSKR